MRASRSDAGSTIRYIDLDSASLEPEHRPLLALLAPSFLATGALEELFVGA